MQEHQRAAAELAGESCVAAGFVLVNAVGDALDPQTLSSRRQALWQRARVTRVRLHDARHTGGRLLLLHSVPVAVVAAWLGHLDAAFTMRTYLHSQTDALPL